MTKLEQLTKKAVLAFMSKRSDRKVTGVRHIYPRCYVLSRAAASCLLVACPPQDGEPHIKKMNKVGDNGTIIRCFDDSLKAGDWCSVAYVSSAASGESVAVKAVMSHGKNEN
jgi:hypothetical protein